MEVERNRRHDDQSVQVVQRATGDLAAIVLCGGASRRMGQPKHQLRFGQQTALERIVSQVASVVDQVVVVKSLSQESDLSVAQIGSVSIVSDRIPGRGPLEGLASGWASLPAEVNAVFACSCDVPLLSSSVIQRLFSCLGLCDAIVPIDTEHHYPLTAVYQRSARPVVERLSKEGCQRMADLLDRLSLRLISVERFRDLEPQLGSFFNVNTQTDYARARRMWLADQ